MNLKNCSKQFLIQLSSKNVPNWERFLNCWFFFGVRFYLDVDVNDLEEVAPFLTTFAKLLCVTESALYDELAVLLADLENGTFFVGWHIKFLNDLQRQFLPLISGRLFGGDNSFLH